MFLKFPKLARVPASNVLYAGTVPASNFLYAGTVPASNCYQNIFEIKNTFATQIPSLAAIVLKKMGWEIFN